MVLLKYIFPRILFSDLTVIIKTALLGGLLGGIYGAFHDQITYSISPEYFTKLKFQQFAYADFGLGNRIFASTIGFLATWWVGAIAAWFLARRLIPNQTRRVAYRQILNGFLCIFLFGLVFAALGFIYGVWQGPQANFASWQWAFRKYKIDDHWAFVRVAYIHNAGYLGGAIGLVSTLLLIRPAELNGNHELRIRQ